MKKILMALVLCLMSATTVFAQFSSTTKYSATLNKTKIWGYNYSDEIYYESTHGCYLYEVQGYAYLYDLGKDNLAPAKTYTFVFSTKQQLVDFLSYVRDITKDKSIVEGKNVTYKNGKDILRVKRDILGNVVMYQDDICYLHGQWSDNRAGYVAYNINAAYFTKKIFKKLDAFDEKK